MIVSFHPSIPGDRFFWERGRIDRQLMTTIAEARAVILPPTVDRELYFLCRTLCPRVFPNYDARFRGEGKVGDTLLFWTTDTPHPATTVYPRVEAFVGNHPEMNSEPAAVSFPFVIKGAQGGEGSQTWLIEGPEDLLRALDRLKRLEWQGTYGFIVQEYIANLDRDLRVVVIGDHVECYWRVHEYGFHHNLARGGSIDRESAPQRMAAGKQAVRDFCRQTGINLAAFDLVFRPGDDTPLFLEINYTFGLRGIGRDRYTELLQDAVAAWLKKDDLSC